MLLSNQPTRTDEMDPIEHLRLPLPLTIHPATLKDAACRLGTTDDRYLIVWCQRHQAGAVCDTTGPVWSIACPIDLADFIGSLRVAGFALPGDIEMQAWVDACTAALPSSATH